MSLIMSSAAPRPIGWIFEFALKTGLFSVLRRLDNSYTGLRSASRFGDKDFLVLGHVLGDLLTVKQTRRREILQDGRTIFNVRRMILRLIEEQPQFMFQDDSSGAGLALSRDAVMAVVFNLDAVLANLILREQMPRVIDDAVNASMPDDDQEVLRSFSSRRGLEVRRSRRSVDGRTLDMFQSKRSAALNKVRLQCKFGKSKLESANFVMKMYKDSEKTLRAIKSRIEEHVNEYPTALETFLDDQLTAAAQTAGDEDGGAPSCRGDDEAAPSCRGDDDGGAPSCLDDDEAAPSCLDDDDEAANPLMACLRNEVRSEDERDDLLTENGLMDLLDRFDELRRAADDEDDQQQQQQQQASIRLPSTFFLAGYGSAQKGLVTIKRRS